MSLTETLGDGHGDAVVLAVTLLLDRDLVLGAPGAPARGRSFVTDRYGPAATDRAISAAVGGGLANDGVAAMGA
jgi:hypothetical protein